jgi:tetratricopeptide (TPR) repeat protein
VSSPAGIGRPSAAAWPDHAGEKSPDPAASALTPSGASTPATSLSKAIERPDAAYLAGLAALDRGDYQQALRLLSTAIEVDRDVWAYLKRAAVDEQTGDRERAIADYRSVLAIDRTAQMKRHVEAAIERISTISPAER